MLTRKDRQRFERLTLPHLDAAYNLALWLMKNPSEAEDVVQHAYLKAFEAFEQFSGSTATAWIMTIVRNTAFTALDKLKRSNNLVSFDEALHKNENPSTSTFEFTPEQNYQLNHSKKQMECWMSSLKAEYREILFLRDIEGYSYKEIADIVQVPKGTVMSRLSRAREQLKTSLLTNQSKVKRHEV